MIRHFLRSITDNLLIRPLRYIRFKTTSGEVQRVISPLDVLSTMHNNAVLDSATYAETHMQSAMAFEDKKAMWDYVVSLCGDGIYAEFGVWKGESINHFARLLRAKNTCIYGFDSFLGLSDNWPGLGQARGYFSLNGEPPPVEGNVTLIPGWFDESIPKFLASNNRTFAFVHVDCDTYRSTLTVLRLIGERLAHGSIILFDEYFGYRGWRQEEWKAWQEFVRESKIEYDYVAFSNAQVAVRVSRSESATGVAAGQAKFQSFRSMCSL
jgi:hypothetical protein